MLVENATSPWGQSWERVFHKHSCIQFIALEHSLWKALSQDCPHGEIRHSHLHLHIYFWTLSLVVDLIKSVICSEV